MALPFNAQNLDFRKFESSFLCMGTTARISVTTLEDVRVVLKSPHKIPLQDEAAKAVERECSDCLKREIEVLGHLGPHPRIIRFIAACQDEILLEYHPNGCLIQYFERMPPASTPLILSWAAQLGEGLLFLHSKKIIHGDFSIENILVTKEKELVLADFAGSPSIGRPGFVAYGTRYASPKYGLDSPREQCDIFALGTVLYEISSWKRAFLDIPNLEIEEQFKAGIFPDMSTLVLGSIIQRCWRDEFEDAEKFLESVPRAPVRFSIMH